MPKGITSCEMLACFLLTTGPLLLLYTPHAKLLPKLLEPTKYTNFEVNVVLESLLPYESRPYFHGNPDLIWFLKLELNSARIPLVLLYNLWTSASLWCTVAPHLEHGEIHRVFQPSLDPPPMVPRYIPIPLHSRPMLLPCHATREHTTLERRLAVR